MVYLFSIIQLVLIAIILVIEFNKKSPAMFLWATLLLMFGIMHFISCLMGTNKFSNSVLNKASVFVILFCIMYLGIRIMLLKGNISHPNECLTHNNINSIVEHTTKSQEINYLIGLGFVVIISIVYLIVELGGLGNTSWGASREVHTSYINVNQLLFVLYCLFSGLLMYGLFKKNTFLIISSSVLILVKVIVTRNRVEVIPFFICFLAFYLIKHQHITLSTIIVCLFGACIVIYIVYALRAYRWYGTINNFLKTYNHKDFNNQVMEFFKNDDGELGLRKWFYYFIDNNNDFKNFGQFHTYRRVLLTFVPTEFSLGIKPPDFAQSMGAAIGMIEGGSMHPTLFGDAYANAGLYGIFLGAFWAVYVSFFDRLMVVFKNGISLFFYYNILAYAYVVMGRGAVYNGNVIMMYGVLLLVVVNCCMRRVKLNGK